MAPEGTGFSVRVIKDSVSTVGKRLTTVVMTLPRIVLAELNTHRMLSRNSASSRAIPVETMLQRVKERPYVPTVWGKNQAGMQSREELGATEQIACGVEWMNARGDAVKHTERLMQVGLHKQTANRLLEPFMWHTVVITATEWSNLLHLRNHPDASPDIQVPARMLQEALETSTPVELRWWEWHCPFVGREYGDSVNVSGDARGETTEGEYWRKVSAARCARVSYLTHEGKREVEKDLELYDRLVSSGHMSPLEHVARPMDAGEHELFNVCWWTLESGLRVPMKEEPAIGPGSVHRLFGQEVVSFEWKAFCGNFDGWVQTRKLIANEHDILGRHPQ